MVLADLVATTRQSFELVAKPQCHTWWTSDPFRGRALGVTQCTVARHCISIGIIGRGSNTVYTCCMAFAKVDAEQFSRLVRVHSCAVRRNASCIEICSRFIRPREQLARHPQAGRDGALLQRRVCVRVPILPVHEQQLCDTKRLYGGDHTH